MFPLHDDAWIDADEPAELPARCRPWAEAAGWWRWRPGLDGSDGYIFLDGTADTCQRAAAALMVAGLAVVRTGPNMSDEPGDWFLRIEGGDPRPALTALLGETEATPAAAGSGLRERLLGEALERALAERDQLAGRLDEALAAVRDATRPAPAAASIAAPAGAEPVPVASPPPEPSPVPPPQRPPAARLRLERELQLVAAALLPRLELLRGSLAFIAVELPDRAGIWRVLAALERDTGGRPEGWKSLKGCHGWSERHFSTGQDDQGRIYAHANPATGGWMALVSHKQTQERDLRWLRAWRADGRG